MRNLLSIKDMKAIKEKYGVDIYGFALEASVGNGKLVPDMAMIEAVCEYCDSTGTYLEGSVAKAIQFVTTVLTNSLGGGEEEKKS